MRKVFPATNEVIPSQALRMVVEPHERSADGGKYAAMRLRDFQ